jgi:hypothetical protein
MQLFINNWAATLTAPALAGDLQLSVDPAQASRLTGLGGGDHYLLTLAEPGEAGGESAWEIVRVTGGADGVLTVERGQEGASAAAWSVGAEISARLTAGALEALRASGGEAPEGGAALTGESAPTEAPPAIGALYITTEGEMAFIAAGADHPEQWVQFIGGAPGWGYYAAPYAVTYALERAARRVSVYLPDGADMPVSATLNLPAWPVLPRGFSVELLGSAAAPITVNLDLAAALPVDAPLVWVGGQDFESGASIARAGSIVTVVSDHPVRLELTSIYSYDAGDGVMASEVELSLRRLPYSLVSYIDLGD